MRFVLLLLALTAVLYLSQAAPLITRHANTDSGDIDIVDDGGDDEYDPVHTKTNVRMSFVRMCAAFHCEACAPESDPAGPCQRREECVSIACDPRQAGSCATDANGSFCSEFECPQLVRSARSPLFRLAHRSGGVEPEEDQTEDDSVQQEKDV